MFADVLPDQNMNPEKIEKLITKKTKAIMPVHLTGRSCDMSSIMKIAKKHNIEVIEDCAQAFGSKFNGNSVAHLVCWLFLNSSTKNFNALGDGGFIVTKIQKFMIE